MSYTLTYDEKVKGWTSFFSFIPEAMANLNGDFYSFKDGQIYAHNQDTASRNSFYGQPSASTEIEFVTNQGPSDIKIFKGIDLESNNKNWDTIIVTDLDAGHINKESFSTKEGRHYAYVRRNSSDKLNTELLSIQGVGSVYSVRASVVEFESIPPSVRVGDTLYTSTGSENKEIGVISGISKNIDGRTEVSVDSFLNTPIAAEFSFVAKNPIAESYGLKGYYANVRLSNQDTSAVELFAVNNEIVKSFP